MRLEISGKERRVGVNECTYWPFNQNYLCLIVSAFILRTHANDQSDVGNPAVKKHSCQPPATGLFNRSHLLSDQAVLHWDSGGEGTITLRSSGCSRSYKQHKKAKCVQMFAHTDAGSTMVERYQCDSGEMNLPDPWWESFLPMCTAAGQGASLFSHPRVVQALLPAGMGHGDRRRDQPETWVRTSVLVVCRVV